MTRVLPDYWRLTRLDEAAEVTLGQSPPGDSYNESAQGVPFFQGKAEFGKLHPEVRKFTTAGTKFAKAGDILLSVRAPVGPTNIATVDCAIGRGLAGIRARSDVNQKYLLWALRSQAETLASMGAGSTFPAVTGKQVRSLHIPIAPPPEQLRIVDILEDHLSRLDAANAYLDANARRLRSLEEQVVLSRLVPNAASKAAALIAAGTLPHLPTEWTWTTLGDAAAIAGGVTKDAKKQSDPTYVEVPYLRVANVQRTRLDLRDVSTIRVRPAQAEALRLLPGDVLLNEGGDRDKLARGWIWSGEIPACIHQNHVFRARPDTDRVRPEWLAWCANTYGSHWAQRHGRQSVNLASISLKTLSTMPVPIAPLAVQDRLLAEITDFREGQQNLAASVDAAQRRSTALRRALLGAAFAGQLSGRASDVDRAEEAALS